MQKITLGFHCTSVSVSQKGIIQKFTLKEVKSKTWHLLLQSFVQEISVSVNSLNPLVGYLSNMSSLMVKSLYTNKYSNLSRRFMMKPESSSINNGIVPREEGGKGEGSRSLAK